MGSKMVIFDFLQVNPDTIWQPCSMIILSQFSFQVLSVVLLLWPRTMRHVSHGKLVQVSICFEEPTERRTGDEDGSARTQQVRGWGVSRIREMVIHSDGDCRKSRGCPVQQARCESALFTPLQGFLSRSLSKTKLLSITMSRKMKVTNEKKVDHKIHYI